MPSDSPPYSGSITVDSARATRLIKYPIDHPVTIDILQCIEWGKLTQCQRMVTLTPSEKIIYYVWNAIPKRVTLNYELLNYHPLAPYHSQTSPRFPRGTQDEDQPYQETEDYY